MTEQDYALGISRVRGAVGIDDGVAFEVKNEFMPCATDVWESTCTWVIQHCKYKARVADFVEARGNVMAQRRNVSATRVRTDCPECGINSGWLEAFYVVERLGEAYSGVVPCTRCNPRSTQAKSAGDIVWISRQRFDEILASKRRAAAELAEKPKVVVNEPADEPAEGGEEDAPDIDCVLQEADVV